MAPVGAWLTGKCLSSRDLQANSGLIIASGHRGGQARSFQATGRAGEMTAVRRMTVKALSGAAAALALVIARSGLGPECRCAGRCNRRSAAVRGNRRSRPAARFLPGRHCHAPGRPAGDHDPAAGHILDAAAHNVARSNHANVGLWPRPIFVALPRRFLRRATFRPLRRQAATQPAFRPERTPSPRRRRASRPGRCHRHRSASPERPNRPRQPGEGGLSWSWIAALLALVGGGAFIAWNRRNRRGRYGDPGRMAFAGLVPDAGPEAAPLPPVRPRPDPVPPRSLPTPAGPTAASPKPSKPAPASDGLIVSTRLKPQLTIHFQPDRAVVTETDVMLQFDVVHHQLRLGPGPRRAGRGVHGLRPCRTGRRKLAASSSSRLARATEWRRSSRSARISLKSAVRLPIAQLHSFDGRGTDAVRAAGGVQYPRTAAMRQTSASFLVGRGTETDEKLAPFRLDLGPRIFRGLSARSHSMGLNQQVA